jgi:hypothetical protein
MRINWKVFEGNSSTEAAVAEFGSGKLKTYRAWMRACWPREAKAEIRRIAKDKSITIDAVRERCKRQGRKFGFSSLRSYS